MTESRHTGYGHTMEYYLAIKNELIHIVTKTNLKNILHGILQARILEWVAIFYARGSSQLGMETMSPASPALAGGFFTIKPSGKPTWLYHILLILSSVGGHSDCSQFFGHFEYSLML